MPRPNILYLHSHDTGRYISPYGHAMPTPNLQRVAEDGVLFRQAFCAAPTCSPSRAALLTGQCAHSAGMLGLAHRNFGFALNDYSHHIIHILNTVGYHSVLAGVSHIAKNKADQGYDEILTVGEGGVAGAAEEFLQRQSTEPSAPFFLDVGFADTHREFPEVGPEDDPRYCQPPAPLPDTPEIRADMAAFKTSVRRLDNDMGRVLDALQATGLDRDTLVICTTDHGLAFPAMKCNLTDHGIGVMLVMRGPEDLAGGIFSGGGVCDALVSHIDVFPTVCDLLDIEPPAWLEGRSLLPLLRGEAEQVNEAIFAEINFHSSFEPARALRTSRWKYIRRFDDRDSSVLVHCDGSPSKEYWLAQGWSEQWVDQEQLYDLCFDPMERHNLADDPAHGGVLDAMRERLRNWMEQTNDPLLQGALTIPDGAELNHPDATELGQTRLEDTGAFVEAILRSANSLKQ